MRSTNDTAFNALFWLLYFLYQWLGLASLYGDYDGYFINACMALPVSLIFSVVAVHVFFRHYYQKDRKAAFYLGAILVSLALLLARRYVNYYFIYPRYFPQALNMPFISWAKLLVEFVNLYAITGLYALYYFIRYWYEERQRVQELLQQNTRAELDLLKAQVQPHFVFNTLNNIYATAFKSSPETAVLIAHLSGFLDYNLYHTSRDKVALTAEIDYIRHYIELQKNRYGKKVDVSVNIFDEINDLQIAPLLLLPLVENCFKHGVGDSVEKSWVRIDVSREAEKFSIMIENSRDEISEQIIPNVGGIGLLNVRKRLQLIYQRQHELKIIEGPNSYLVILKIQIEKNDQVFNRR
ncbi:histidine kinase [Dyadobacter sp. CY107]|uniref:sensor histidine kinase n=1 Tax=Dyadobacter fanqingshengii TaxID=2906443 RepID=UPI001F3BD8ED|nr:histidine kinase [Dyadobacter fanqingshengii]MCF2505503.1 histidine kinase [Dyadobacter fanqingshengii]